MTQPQPVNLPSAAYIAAREATRHTYNRDTAIDEAITAAAPHIARAERERIRQLAIQHGARCSPTSQAHNTHWHSFADLLTEGDTT